MKTNASRYGLQRDRDLRGMLIDFVRVPVRLHLLKITSKPPILKSLPVQGGVREDRAGQVQGLQS